MGSGWPPRGSELRYESKEGLLPAQDPTFAIEAKREHHLLKLTMLSGRSTVVAAEGGEDVEL
eukprot:3315854-Amphidinium_carterae.1